MVTVGSIGGHLDHWKKRSKDYLEYHKSISQYGWILVQVDNDSEYPKITLKRFGYGNKDTLQDNGVIDEFSINAGAKKPNTPEINLIEQIKKETILNNNSYKIHISP